MTEINQIKCKIVGDVFIIISMLLILSSIVFTACAPQHFTPVEKTLYTSVKTLSTAKIFRHASLTTCDSLWREGIINDELAGEIKDVGTELAKAINTLADMLDIVEQGGEAVGLEAQMNLYYSLYGKFSDLVLPYIYKGIE